MQTWQHTLSSFHHDVPLAINQMAAEPVWDNWIGTCGKTTKIHSSHHTPQEFLFVCFASLALLRAWSVLHSSVNWYRPILSMDLKKSAGISFVKESANWYLPSIHRMHPLFWRKNSRMMDKSMQVRLSEALMALGRDKANTDFASVTKPNSIVFNESSQSGFSFGSSFGYIS